MVGDRVDGDRVDGMVRVTVTHVVQYNIFIDLDLSVM